MKKSKQIDKLSKATNRLLFTVLNTVQIETMPKELTAAIDEVMTILFKIGKAQ